MKQRSKVLLRNSLVVIAVRTQEPVSSYDSTSTYIRAFVRTAVSYLSIYCLLHRQSRRSIFCMLTVVAIKKKIFADSQNTRHPLEHTSHSGFGLQQLLEITTFTHASIEATAGTKIASEKISRISALLLIRQRLNLL